VGNRLSSLTVPSYSYNSSNELTTTPSISYTYDNNGNTLSKTSSGAVTQYIWDFENRLRSVALPGTGGTATFKYDPFGRRIQKSFAQGSTTTTTNYVYDGSNSIEEVDQNANLLARYTQADSVDEPLAEVHSGTVSYYEQDGLGSVTSTSSSGSSLANTYIYDSFGNLMTSGGVAINPFQYTGRDYDLETSLRYYRARYYDSGAGRFLSEDAARFAADVNFYAYVRGNPINLIDPYGLCPPQQDIKPWDMRDAVINLLKGKNECSAWFNAGSDSAVGIMSHVPIILYEGPPNEGGTTRSDRSSPIFVNSRGSFYASSPYSYGGFPPGSFGARMVILLHELAHKVMPPGFTRDGRLDDPANASEKNTQRVVDHCKDAIKWWAFLMNME
jgi:RHS repeat-associated protein